MKMNRKECIKAKCEYLAVRVIDKEDMCLDTSSELSRVCMCAIVDEMYKKKGK